VGLCGNGGSTTDFAYFRGTWSNRKRKLKWKFDVFKVQFAQVRTPPYAESNGKRYRQGSCQARLNGPEPLSSLQFCFRSDAMLVKQTRSVIINILHRLPAVSLRSWANSLSLLALFTANSPRELLRSNRFVPLACLSSSLTTGSYRVVSSPGSTQSPTTRAILFHYGSFKSVRILLIHLARNDFDAQGISPHPRRHSVACPHTWPDTPA
jgi:hypothetical protein